MYSLFLIPSIRKGTPLLSWQSGFIRAFMMILSVVQIYDESQMFK